MKKLKNNIKKINTLSLDFFFPRYCVNCDRQGRYICDDCSLFLCEINLVCPVCFKENYSGRTHEKCQEKENLDGLVSFWENQGIIKRAISLATKGTFHIFDELIEEAFFLIIKDSERFSSFFSFLVEKETKIVFFDSFEENKNFNESEFLAEALSKKIGKSTVDLDRDKDISGTEKAVLVTSRWVSGSKVKERCRILKRKGVKKVWALTLARE
jgi:predicted amidophosphoribosyltransferase